jgi:hypothetical protein
VSGADAQLYNNASQVALVRKGNHTVMTLSNNYKGPPEDFAMVVPVPVVLQKEQVKTLSPDVFKHIDELSAPRLVEYWEQDPCAPVYPEPMKKMAPGGARVMRSAGKGGGGADLGVTIEAKFEVGEYQILILSAKDSTGLAKWQVAAPQQVQDPKRRRRSPGALHPRPDEVLCRQGRHQKGAAR